MSELKPEKYRLLVATQYWIASNSILQGMKRQLGTNDFHVMVTLRSFLEYTRRGIWFLAWASEKELRGASKLTFDKPGSPSLVRMEEMINEALGLGSVSHLRDHVKGMGNETFVDCLHALTHGNPISVRMQVYGLEKIFKTDMLVKRAELELDQFTVLICRRSLGQDLHTIWVSLSAVINRPEEMKANARIAYQQAKEAASLKFTASE